MKLARTTLTADSDEPLARLGRLAGSLAALCWAGLVGCATLGHETADTVLQNGQVVTIDARDSIQQAVAIRGGRIVYVGTQAGLAPWVGHTTRVVDLGGRMLMPGFVDAHLHALAGGRSLLQCDLAYEPLSHTQLLSKLRACLDATKDKSPDTWLEAVNWDRQSTFSRDGDPTKALLDGLDTRRPITVTSSDFHSVLSNSRGLWMAGIKSTTPDPAGGKFVHDATGELTGIAEDAAGWQLKGAIPADSDAELLAQARLALATLRQQGVTTFMDAAAGPGHAKAFKALYGGGELSARANFAILLPHDDTAPEPARIVADAKALAAQIDQGEPGAAPGLTAHTVKIFMDGVVNAPADTGALLTPYLGNSGTAADPRWVPGTNLGELYYAPEKLRAILGATVDAGLDAHIHATGERAVRQALDAIESIRTRRPAADFRPSIAHAETVATPDYARFALLQTTATISFQWAQRATYSIGDTEHHLGPERFSRMEPFGSLRRAGARISYGSDWPVDPYDIFLALKVGVTRSGDPANPHSAASQKADYLGPINGEPALSRADVLRAATLNAAYQLRMEDLVGSIEVGKLADLIVLDKNFLTAADDDLGRNRILLTMVGGRIVMATAPFTDRPASAR